MCQQNIDTIAHINLASSTWAELYILVQKLEPLNDSDVLVQVLEYVREKAHILMLCASSVWVRQ